jgi:hypothetical protein
LFSRSGSAKSDDPLAHSISGVLAQQNRLGESIVQFQEVLRLDPANAAAKQYLHTATAREQSKQ